MRAFFICALHVRLMSIDHAVLLQFVWHSREGLTQREREQDVVTLLNMYTRTWPEYAKKVDPTLN